MKVDWFMSSLGIADAEDVPDGALDVLSDDAEGFLRAGGVLSHLEWQALSGLSRDAFTEAGDRIRRETIGLTAVAIHKPILAEAFLSGEDPENLAVRSWLKSTADDLEKKVRG